MGLPHQNALYGIALWGGGSATRISGVNHNFASASPRPAWIWIGSRGLPSLERKWNRMPPTLKTTGTTDHSAASFSASAAAFSAAALASTSSTMCSTIDAPSIVWSVFPAA